MTRVKTEPLWTAGDVADFLGVPVSTLYRWRYRRTGPRACRVGRYLRYRSADVLAWVEQQVTCP
jgi:predicted DNA-binding transcriptional regulator AlpA